MASCPFCHGAISEQIALHGGHCPHCFGDVPGEEAATDPGEQLAAKQQAEDQVRVQKAARRPLLVFGPVGGVLLAAVGFAVYQQVTAPKVERLDFAADEFTINMELAQYEAPPEPTPAAQATPSEAPRKQAALLSAPRAGSSSGGSTEPEPAAGVAASGMDIAFSAKRAGAVLTSRDDLQAAVRDLFKSRAAKLQGCFESRVAQVDSLQGSWRLSFTIDEGGRATEVSAVGDDMEDAVFERCLVGEMQTWQVRGQLEKPWPVSLPVAFKR